MSHIDEAWVAPDGLRTPDFIICGAMKCGTTTLHYTLNQHPDIYIPDGEVHFFDMDDPLQHPRFSYFDGREWKKPAFAEDPQGLWRWYASQFADAGAGQTTGEDSTLYLLSETAAKRIALQPKPIKLLIMLRHPTDRAYSQYWHMVASGRARFSFEETIRHEPHSVLYRSLYVQYLKRFLAHVDRDLVKVLIFEEFIADMPTALREVCAHIGVDYERLPTGVTETHLNPARLPLSLGLQLTMNKLFPAQTTLPVVRRVPTELTSGMKAKVRLAKTAHKAYRALNPLTSRRPPAMNASTRRFLDDYFSKELRGIDELVGRDVWSLWFKART